MIDAVVLLCVVVVLAICWCLWRALRLLTRWRSAAAVVWACDYTDAQVADDRFAFGLLREPVWSDDDTRSVDEVVEFEDEGGTRHRAQISRRVVRGRSPDGAYVVWYDPADPSRVTAFGPGGWALGAVLLAGALAVVLQTAVRLRF